MELVLAPIVNSARCRCNAVQYKTILHLALQSLGHNMNQNFYSRASDCDGFLKKKNECVITTSYTARQVYDRCIRQSQERCTTMGGRTTSVPLSYNDRVSSLASYIYIRKIAGCACAGNAGNVPPTTDFNENR